MTKDEIIDYVLNSPENTNPNILKGMLDQLDSGEGNEDFSIAEVTFTREVPATIQTPIIDEETQIMGTINIEEDGTYKIPIYKNGTFVSADYLSSTTVIITGNIIYANDSVNFIIQGDGTITVTSTK